MYYRQIEPPPDLTPWVECAWFLETALAPEGQLIVPDGRRELIFHFAARPLCASLQQAGTLITSNLNQALELALTGTMKVFGVRLQPFASETGLAELALDTGFQDQSHLVNDFRAFCGQSPEAYFRSGRGMTEFYRDGFLQDTPPR